MENNFRQLNRQITQINFFLMKEKIISKMLFKVQTNLIFFKSKNKIISKILFKTQIKRGINIRLRM